jgi:hypothetical protein
MYFYFLIALHRANKISPTVQPTIVPMANANKIPISFSPRLPFLLVYFYFYNTMDKENVQEFF